MQIVLVVGSVFAMAGVAVADLPRSLNFENQTGSRIMSTQSEDSSNEKEVEFGDIDNDGDLDMVIAVGSSDFGARKNKLYRNDDGVFIELSGLALIPEFAQEDVSRNAFLRDYNQDGFLDIYIINDSNSSGFAGRDHIYIAEHTDGVLTGYSEEGATRIASSGELGAACGGVSYDFDGNGYPDVYSGNYPGPSQDVILINDTMANLDNLTSTLAPSDSAYTVDVSTGDMNGDGKMDLLISNWSANQIYYNDNAAGSSGLGDYRYTGSTQSLGTGGAQENAMEPADFDGDGDLDIYWANGSGSTGDRILRNDGNDAGNKATFATLNVLPSSVTTKTSRKASVGDLNGDGRVDLYVGNESGGRGVILRNTTVGGDISFVDWTPTTAITSTGMRGWHGGIADTNGDGDLDIVIGAFSGDHLLETTLANEVSEDAISGMLPALWNSDPVAVMGSAMSDGEVDTYMVSDSASGFLSVVVNGDGDYVLEILDGGGSVLATVDRGGEGVEEAIQISTSGTRQIRVTATVAGGGCGGPDIDGNCVVDFADLLAVLAAWGPCKCVEDIDGSGTVDFGDLLEVLGNWGPVVGGGGAYQLEVLGRS